ncbi:MAG: amidohydrolase family protein, partial [Flavobacteriaceae bacterium]
ATAHIGDGSVIENSRIVLENGKITFIGENNSSKTESKGQFINADGKHVYPGFIALNSTLGLAEIDAVKATLDTREMGAFNPHIRSIIAYNTESKVTETVLVNGVLMGQITPRGGRISGTSSMVQFDAWNYEDALVKEDEGIHLNWPTSFNRSGWWAQPGSLKENKNYTKQTQEIITFFDENKQIESDKINLKQVALKGLFDGNKTLYIHVNGEKEIIDAIAFKNQFAIKKIVIIGGFESTKQTELLIENNIAVIIQRVHSLPTAEDQDIKLPFKNAKILDDAGITVAFDTAGSMERMNTRNLPFLAGTAVAYGLDYEKAIKMLTLNAAKITGIDKQIGTLEVGKDATLFISTGDALDMRTNNVTHVLIKGKFASLDTHQKRLYRKFKDK